MKVNKTDTCLHRLKGMIKDANNYKSNQEKCTIKVIMIMCFKILSKSH